jgi:hypothetical protein
MAFLRQYLVPFLTILVFLVALVVVSARIFLPSDMAAPAPTGEVELTLTDEMNPPSLSPATAN